MTDLPDQPQQGPTRWPPPAPPAGYQPQYGYQGYPPQQAPGTNGFAIASLVLGIVWLWWIGSILALVFGYVAKSQIRQSGQAGSGLATAGIVLGWVGVGLGIILVIVVISNPNVFSSTSNQSLGYLGV